MVMMFNRSWFKSPHTLMVAADEAAQPAPAALRRPPHDPLESFVAREIARQGALTHDELVSLVTGWIARQERSTGGALDLFLWSDDLWRDEARRTVARLEGDLIDPPALEPAARS